MGRSFYAREPDRWLPEVSQQRARLKEDFDAAVLCLRIFGVDQKLCRAGALSPD
jgi:hypothetical protein